MVLYVLAMNLLSSGSATITTAVRATGRALAACYIYIIVSRNDVFAGLRNDPPIVYICDHNCRRGSHRANVTNMLYLIICLQVDAPAGFRNDPRSVIIVVAVRVADRVVSIYHICAIHQHTSIYFNFACHHSNLAPWISLWGHWAKCYQSHISAQFISKLT